MTPIAGLDEIIPTPEDNPFTLPALLLGRRLFFEKGLSRNASMSCASCHLPSWSFSDTVAKSVGVGGMRGRRNTPAIINRGYGIFFFWDGRVATLEEQVLEPIRNPLELASSIRDVVARLNRDTSYRRQFRAAFGNEPDASSLARALATYVRSIRSGGSAFDRYAAGDSMALSLKEQRGMALFMGKARCARCHSGGNFTDEQFHNTGVAVGTSDRGREAVTAGRQHRGAFKTPTLRDVARTAPYMHDGSLPTLEAVVAFYVRGGRANPNLDQEIQPLPLTPEEQADLVSFLRTIVADSLTCGPISCSDDLRTKVPDE